MIPQTTKETKEINLTASAVWKCRTGDPLHDDEIEAGIKVLSHVTHVLGSMGDIYLLAFSDLTRKLVQLEGFRDARREE
jgi:hypothetical protein